MTSTSNCCRHQPIVGKTWRRWSTTSCYRSQSMHLKAPFSRQSSGHEDSPPPPQTNSQSLTSSLHQFRAEQLGCIFLNTTRSEELASKKGAVKCTLMLHVTPGRKLDFTYTSLPSTLPRRRHTFPRTGSPTYVNSLTKGLNATLPYNLPLRM